MNKEEFLEEINKLGIKLTIDQVKKLEDFYDLLINWNEKINLTTIVDKKDVYLKHFYDSLTLIKAIDLYQTNSVLDIGTGAGFPGIVLKICFPKLRIVLLDSLTKRINYLNSIIDELGLTDIETVGMRAEEYTKIHREKYDVVVSRAVANLKVLTEISFTSVKENGYMVAMKSDIDDEIIAAKDIIQKMGGEISEIIELELPKEHSKRKLIKIKKVSKTNNKYPRRYAEIKREKK